MLIFQLNETITKQNLSKIAEKLSETAQKLQNPEYSEYRTILKNQALHLNTYQETYVTPMVEQTKEMLALSHRLEENLKFNQSSFQEALDKFKKEIKYAEDFINKEGTEFVRQVSVILFFFFIIFSSI